MTFQNYFQYDAIFLDGPPARNEFVYNMLYNQTEDRVVGAIRYDNWKLLNFGGHLVCGCVIVQKYGISKHFFQFVPSLDTFELYDLDSDPNETTDLFDAMPEVAEDMVQRFNVRAVTSMRPTRPFLKTVFYT